MSANLRNLAYLLALVSFSLAYSSELSAQNWLITGTVLDAHTEEPLPFTNLYVANQNTTGTTTDFDGKFKVWVNSSADSLVAAVIGYGKVSKPISNASEQKMIFRLSRDEVGLEEIVINPGENPAHPLFRNIIANKDRNDKRRIQYYSFEVYNKLEIDLDNLSQKFQDRKLFKPFNFIFDNIDSTSEDKPFLPIFLTETLSDYYYRADPSTRREFIKASKISGMENESITQFLGSMYQDVNVYENWINILGREFVSPISNSGLFYYRYYLEDSATIDSKWCYKLRFVPKRKGETTFIGDFWVHDSTFAIKMISMKLAKHVNVNFVSKMSIYQEYDHYLDTIWMISKDKVIADFIKPENSPSIIGRKTTTYRNYTINDTSINAFLDSRQDVVMSEDIYAKDDAFWRDARHEELSENEAAIYHMIDTLKDLKVVKTYTALINTIATGYKKFGPIEIGNLFTFYNYNDLEGHRVKFGMRTSPKFSDRLRIGGYGAYGFGDKRWKYAGDLLYLLTKRPRQAILASYRKDIISTSDFDDNFGQGGLLSNFVLRRRVKGELLSVKLMDIVEARATYEKEWVVGFSSKVHFKYRELLPYFNFRYPLLSDANQTDTLANTRITSNELGLTLRFAHQEKFLTYDFARSSLGSKYPIVSLSYSTGVKGFLNGDFDFHKLQLSIIDDVPINPLGDLHYLIQAGRTFGTVPYLLMKVHKGNDGFFLHSYAYNSMLEYEFASDTYVSLFLDHHFNGFFLNKIPGIRKLKLREVFTAKFLYGTMTEANRQANFRNLREGTSEEDDVRIKIPDGVPYIELGAGLENIGKLFRVDLVWRMTHRDPDLKNFGVRFGMDIDF